MKYALDDKVQLPCAITSIGKQNGKMIYTLTVIGAALAWETVKMYEKELDQYQIKGGKNV